MAERRMFAKTIIDSDAFIDMPQSTQLFYFHLSMRADDEGFINNPKSIMRNIGCKDDDLKLLIMKKFIIPFESGVVVIKHWKIHNYIQSDRFLPTKYKDEKSQLELDENKAYRVPKKDENNQCIQNGYSLDTQVSIGKDSIGKDSINNTISEPKQKKIKFGTYKNVLLTEDEYERLKNDYYSLDMNGVIEWFSAYIEEKAYKSKSHNLAIRRWVIDAYSNKNKSNQQKSILERIENL